MPHGVTVTARRDCPACGWDPQLWGTCPQCGGTTFREVSTPMREPLLEKSLVKWVESEDGKCLKLRSISTAGYPDRTILLPYNTHAVAEIKDGVTGELSPRQKVVIRILRKLGVPVFVIDTKEELEKTKKVLKRQCEQNKTSALISGSV